MEGAQKELAGQIADMTTPGNTALVLAAGPLEGLLKAPVGKTLATVFVPQILGSLPQAAQETWKTLNDPKATAADRGAALAKVGGPVALSALMLKAALPKESVAELKPQPTTESIPEMTGRGLPIAKGALPGEMRIPQTPQFQQRAIFWIAFWKRRPPSRLLYRGFSQT